MPQANARVLIQGFGMDACIDPVDADDFIIIDLMINKLKNKILKDPKEFPDGHTEQEIGRGKPTDGSEGNEDNSNTY